jgi:hypothetical protein
MATQPTTGCQRDSPARNAVLVLPFVARDHHLRRTPADIAVRLFQQLSGCVWVAMIASDLGSEYEGMGDPAVVSASASHLATDVVQAVRRQIR